MYVRIYYQVCTKCGARFNAKLHPQSKEIRVGREFYTCKCGEQYATGRREWANLTTEERRSYFLSSAEVGVLLICASIPALFAYFVADGLRSAGTAATWGAVVGILLVGLLWLIKIVIVKLSVRRVPVVRATIEPPGFLPWQW